MTRGTAERLLRLYPRAWRERYGDEFLLLLAEEEAGPRVVADVIAGAFDAWMRAAAGARTPAQADGPSLVAGDVDDAWSLRHLRVIAMSVGAAFAVYGAAGFAQWFSGDVWWLEAMNQPAAMLGVFYGGYAVWWLRHRQPITRAVGVVVFGAPFLLVAILRQAAS